MTATVQTAIVALVLLAAAVYLGRRGWATLAAARRPKEGPGCGSGCGCGDES